jgi:hypothetical protein
MKADVDIRTAFRDCSVSPLQPEQLLTAVGTP